MRRIAETSQKSSERDQRVYSRGGKVETSFDGLVSLEVLLWHTGQREIKRLSWLFH